MFCVHWKWNTVVIKTMAYCDMLGSLKHKVKTKELAMKYKECKVCINQTLRKNKVTVQI